MEHMIDSVIFAGFLISRQVAGVFYYHNRTVVTFCTAADRTKLLVCERKALFAVTDIISGAGHGSCQLFYLLLRHIYDMKRKSLSRFCAYSGELGQFFDQSADLTAVIIH